MDEVVEAGDFKRCAAAALKALDHDKDCGQEKVCGCCGGGTAAWVSLRLRFALELSGARAHTRARPRHTRTHTHVRTHTHIYTHIHTLPPAPKQSSCSFSGAWRGKPGRMKRVYYVSSYFWDRALDAGIIADKAAIEWRTSPGVRGPFWGALGVFWEQHLRGGGV